MRRKKKILTHFSHTMSSQSFCIRPEHEEQLARYMADNPKQNVLIRGSGLSYNDSCFNTNGLVIDNERFNHFLHFDSKTGIVLCQGGVLLKDLFSLHPQFIPPVIPGTLYATIAGAIAHDVHGKNNHHLGSFGHHLCEFDLLVGGKNIHCSRDENNDLFYATIAGLGLTGVITRAAIRLKKASRFVHVKQKQFVSVQSLTESMATEGVRHDYQVAWLDLLNPIPRGIHSLANHCDSFNHKEFIPRTIPKIPFSLIKPWNIKLFNQHFFDTQKADQQLTLEQFNNPLDKLMHWNRLYGPKGLIQFQALFSSHRAAETLDQLVELIRMHRATPTLSVLKFFTHSGDGLLSFCKPSFTLAIDFIHNAQAKQAISSMNAWISERDGRIYLAKDLLLNEEQYKKMYQKHEEFSQTLKRHACAMQSDLAKRLGIKK